MRIFKLVVGPFEMNSYIVAEDNGDKCFLIDPGDEPDKIIAEIEINKLLPTRIINTHNHIDHTRHLSVIKEHFNIPFYIHEDDLPLLETLKEQALFFGFEASPVPEVNGFVKDGETFQLGDLNFKILHTPGHSPGSICIYSDGHVFVGDVLFKESIGRTDLYGGDYKVLMTSIREKLLTLPDDTIVHSGHGPETTIGIEKQKNPFLQNIHLE
ncbi:MAG: MBL fold metallo-hydrolase [Calditrichaeota bacterium]|nr:MBL fold metallo-hydrolase [Calditrichota bacterium]